MDDIEEKLDELYEAQLSMNNSISMIAKLIKQQCALTKHLIEAVTQIVIADTNELSNALRKGWVA